MTGLEKIVKQIKDEAGNAAGEKIAAAEESANRLLEEARARGEEMRLSLAKQSAEEAENALSSANSGASLQKRRMILGAKQRIIGEMIRDAQSSLNGLPDDRYFSIILIMAEKFSLPQDGEMLFSKRDLGRLPADFQARVNKVLKDGSLGISKDTRNIEGGFILAYGGIEENCSFEALFDAARETLQDKVHELLFS